MIYTVILHNHSYDLPAKTLVITEKLDNAAGVDQMAGLSTREKYKVVLDCVVEVLGAENVKEAIGSCKVEEVDLNDITLTFRKIVDAYNKPLQEYSMNANRADLESLPLDQITALAEAAKSVSAMQAAAPVKK